MPNSIQPKPRPKRLEDGNRSNVPYMTGYKPSPPIVLKLSREQAEVLAIALFGKIQLLEQNECDICTWCSIDVWKLYCRIGQSILSREEPQPPPPPPPNGIAEWRKAVDEKLLEHEREIDRLHDLISELTRNAD